MDVAQAVYESDAPPVRENRLRIMPATEEDLAFIEENYSLLEEEVLQKIVGHGQLYLGYEPGGECVGFIGQHMEGSVGLLEILPEHRRKGYGAELEAFLIGEMLRQGLIPYCQFETSNHASRALQKKLGLRVMDGEIVWLF